MNLTIFLVWDGFVFRDNIVTSIIVSFFSTSVLQIPS
jgi:hypothetical protein